MKTLSEQMKLIKTQTTIACPSCNGIGKQNVTGKTLTDQGWVEEAPVIIDCIWCYGTGRMTPQQMRDIISFQNAWCECGNSSEEADYYETPSGAHGWNCRDCGKIVQTG